MINYLLLKNYLGFIIIMLFLTVLNISCKSKRIDVEPIKSDDPKIRIEAVEKITHQDTLMKIAYGYYHEDVKINAIHRITDQEFLIEMYEDQQLSGSMTKAALCGIQDEGLLFTYASDHRYSWRRTAASKLRDSTLIDALIMKENSFDIIRLFIDQFPGLTEMIQLYDSIGMDYSEIVSIKNKYLLKYIYSQGREYNMPNQMALLRLTLINPNLPQTIVQVRTSIVTRDYINKKTKAVVPIEGRKIVLTIRSEDGHKHIFTEVLWPFNREEYHGGFQYPEMNSESTVCNIFNTPYFQSVNFDSLYDITNDINLRNAIGKMRRWKEHYD